MPCTAPPHHALVSKLTASAVCLPLLAGGQHSQKDSLEHCQAQRVPSLCPVGEEGPIVRIHYPPHQLPYSPRSYHAALQSHKQPENVICPLKDPEDAKISEHTLYPRLLPQGKTDHMSQLGCVCLLLALQPPRQRSVCTFMKPMPPMIWMHSSVTFQAAS